MRNLYKIETTLDRDNKKKEIPAHWLVPEYEIYFLKTGRSAILLMNDNSGKMLQTSTVEEIYVWESNISITTRNTVYVLKPVRSE